MSGESPPLDAYERITDPERFQVLVGAMLDLLAKLEADFDVKREDAFGLGGKLEEGFTPPRSSIRLTPVNEGAAPVVIVFSDPPGLRIRFGLWWEEFFPSCHCDACDEDPDPLIQEMVGVFEDVSSGRFWEEYDPNRNWREGEIWGSSGWSARSGRAAHSSPPLVVPWARRNRATGVQRVAWMPWLRKEGGLS